MFPSMAFATPLKNCGGLKSSIQGLQFSLLRLQEPALATAEIVEVWPFLGLVAAWVTVVSRHVMTPLEKLYETHTLNRECLLQCSQSALGCRQCENFPQISAHKLRGLDLS